MIMMSIFVIILLFHVINALTTNANNIKALKTIFKNADMKLPQSSFLDSDVKSLLNSNPTKTPGLTKTFEKYSKGMWRVKYAPHMNVLEKLLGTRFDVYYYLDGKGSINSNVRFQKPFNLPFLKSGWLSTKGKYYSTSDTDTAISFNQFWLDFNEDSLPSDSNDVENHVLPSFVNTIGKASFIKAISQYPINYLDNDLCCFTFKAVGTKVLATKEPMKI